MTTLRAQCFSKIKENVQFDRRKKLLRLKERFSKIEGKSSFRRAEGSVKLKESASTFEASLVVLFIDNHRNQKKH